MKTSTQTKTRLEQIQSHYALANDLYNKRHKNVSEIKSILKEKGIHLETAELIVKDVELYANVQSKIKAGNVLFLGLMFLVVVILVWLISPSGSFQSEFLNQILIISLGLSGLVLCMIGINKTYLKKSVSKK